MKPISYIHSPFKEKFGIPRQSMLIDAVGKMSFPKNDFYSEAFRGIENFSYLWLIFEFHLIPEEFSMSALVRPPRFDGKRKLGVFATRSPHRPNRLGLSVVKFDRLEVTDREVILWVKGIDLVDKTPIYDIKPYLPYADRIQEAKAEDFEERPRMSKVVWEVEVNELHHSDKELIEKVIGFDPRPGQDRNSTAEYGVSVAGRNVRFSKVNDALVIRSVLMEQF